MMHGLLEFLTGPSLAAKQLRDTFVFKLVPLLNPDGVHPLLMVVHPLLTVVHSLPSRCRCSTPTASSSATSAPT